MRYWHVAGQRAARRQGAGMALPQGPFSTQRRRRSAGRAPSAEAPVAPDAGAPGRAPDDPVERRAS